jgi:hypothetical protein
LVARAAEEVRLKPLPLRASLSLSGTLPEEELELAVSRVQRVFEQEADDVRTGDLQARRTNFFRTPFYALDESLRQTKRELFCCSFL